VAAAAAAAEVLTMVDGLASLEGATVTVVMLLVVLTGRKEGSWATASSANTAASRDGADEELQVLGVYVML
jgi:hypothetical protein